MHAAAEQVHVAADLVDHARQGRQGEGAAGGLRSLGRRGGERPAGHRRRGHAAGRGSPDIVPRLADTKLLGILALPEDEQRL